MNAPMKLGFPGGMAGGGIAKFLQPLQEYLTQTVNSEKIQPFIDEISQLAQDRFDVDFGGGITNPGIGGGLFGGGMPPPLPPVQQPVVNTEPSGPVAGISNFGPDVGNGGLFGGEKPVKTGTLPDFAASAQNYFNPGMGGQSAFGPMGARPEQMVERAQARLAQRDVKPPEVVAYLNNVIKTGGVPTMMAPQPSTNFSSLMSVGLDGGVNSGQMPPGFTPLPPGELGFTENMIGPLQAYTGGSKTFDESAPNMLSPIFRS
jgi:hypothetical protein